MKFWISCEIDSEVGDAFTPIQKEIESTLNSNLAGHSYGDCIEKIALIPMILGPRFPGHKERRLIQHKAKCTDYRLHINFHDFLNGTEQERKVLLVENLLAAVSDIERKLKGKFDGGKLTKDIASLFPYIELRQ